MNGQQKNINYIDILKGAWQITWGNRFLWWFGLFTVFGGGMSSIFPLDTDKMGSDVEESQVASEMASGFINQHPEWVVAGVIIIFILVLLFLALNVVGRIGLIKSVNNISRGELSSFSVGIKMSKKYFWKVLALIFLVDLFIFVSLIVLFVPVASLFYLKSFIAGSISGILAILIIIPLLILAAFIRIYSQMYVILGNLKIISAFENAYNLFRENIYPSIIMGLILIFVSMLVGIAMLVALLIIAVILILVGLVFYLFLNKLGITIAIIIGAIAFIVAIIFIKAIYEVFCQSLWVLFFREIAKIKEEKTEEAVAEIVANKVPEPESI